MAAGVLFYPSVDLTYPHNDPKGHLSPCVPATLAAFHCYYSCRTPIYAGSPPVISVPKEVNSRLAKRPLVSNGRLANRGLTSLVKEATGMSPVYPSSAGLGHMRDCNLIATSPVYIPASKCAWPSTGNAGNVRYALLQVSVALDDFVVLGGPDDAI